MTRHDNDDIGSLFKAIGAKNNQFKEFSTQNNAVQAQERWPLFKTLDLEKRPPPPQLQNAEKQRWQKQASTPAPIAPIAPATRKTGLSLGNKIAKGLHSLARPSPDARSIAPAPLQPAEAASVFAAPEPASAKRSPTRLARPEPSPPSAVPISVTAPVPAPASRLFSGKKTAPIKTAGFGKIPPAAPAAAPAAPLNAPAARGLFAQSARQPATAHSAPPMNSAPGKKSLFGKIASQPAAEVDARALPDTPEAGASATGGKLSSLFARLEQPEPEPGKGLFGRKRKS